MIKPVTLLALPLLFAVLDAAAQTPREPPNLYQFAGGNVTIHYSTSSLEGQPRLSFIRRAGIQKDFAGEEIRVQETDVGQLVTVIARDIPDLKTITLTLLIPDINLDEHGSAMFETRVIFTSHHTTIAGQGGIVGPLQTYYTPQLIGLASNVDFLEPSTAGVFGKVTQSPTCPGPQREGQKCTGPLADAEVELLDDTEQVVAAAVTDANGLFAIHAEPGTYTIAVAAGEPLPHCDPVAVTITDRIATAHVRCDTGIR